MPFLQAEGLFPASPSPEETARLEKIVELLDDRLKVLTDIVELAGFFLAKTVVYDKIAVGKVLKKPGAGDTLAGLFRVLSRCPDFEPETLEMDIREFAERMDLKLGRVVQPLRVAVTGGTASPGIFETLSLLGRETTLVRIDDAMKLIG
jgi:glutamyl-tRNA synthetase